MTGLSKRKPDEWKRPAPPSTLRVELIPAALAAHERAQAESDAIRAKAGLPPVPENASVQAWRERLNGNGNDNGNGRDPLEALIARIEKVRGAYPPEDRADLDEAIRALRRVEGRAAKNGASR